MQSNIFFIDPFKDLYNNCFLFASWLGAWGVAFLTVGFILFIYILHVRGILIPVFQWRLKNSQKFIFAAIVSTTIRLIISIFVDLSNASLFLYLYFVNKTLEDLSSLVYINNPPIRYLWLILYLLSLILSFLFPNFMGFLYVKIDDFFSNMGLSSQLLKFRASTYTLLRGFIPLTKRTTYVEIFLLIICSIQEIALFLVIPFSLLIVGKCYSIAYFLLLINLLFVSYMILYSSEHSLYETNFIFMNFTYFFSKATNDYKNSALSSNEPAFDILVNAVGSDYQPVSADKWDGKYTKIGFDSNFSLKDAILAKHADERPDICSYLVIYVYNNIRDRSDAMFKVFRTMAYLNNDFLYSNFDSLNKRFFSTSSVLFASHPVQEVVETAVKVGAKQKIDHGSGHHGHPLPLSNQPSHQTAVSRVIHEYEDLTKAWENPTNKKLMIGVGATAISFILYETYAESQERAFRQREIKAKEEKNAYDNKIKQMKEATRQMEESTKQMKEITKQMELKNKVRLAEIELERERSLKKTSSTDATSGFLWFPNPFRKSKSDE